MSMIQTLVGADPPLEHGRAERSVVSSASCGCPGGELAEERRRRLRAQVHDEARAARASALRPRGVALRFPPAVVGDALRAHANGFAIERRDRLGVLTRA